MDTNKTGKFLQDLRIEHDLTQEELGEQLGVTNKTISRWETGTYLPPVDILIRLADLYSVTVNEILSGERLATADYQPKAEENIVTTLNNSAKATKNRKMVLIVCLAVILVLAIASAVVISSLVSRGKYYTVTFDMNGGESISVENLNYKFAKRNNDAYTYLYDIENGKCWYDYTIGATYIKGYLIPKPTVSKPNSSLVGWYTNLDESGEKWNFDRNYINGDITLYAKWEEATDGLEYEFIPDSGYALVGTGNVKSPDIVIPSYYNGLPVWEIKGENAFRFAQLNNLTIPDTVHYIGDGAFRGCSFASIQFGKHLWSIRDAFLYCSGLVNLDLPESLERLENNAFSNCSDLRSVVIPDGTTTIGSGCFSYCPNLTSVTLGSSVRNLSVEAFSNCNSLVEVHDMSKYFNVVDNPELFPAALDVYKNNREATKLYLDKDGYLFYDVQNNAQLVRYYGNQTKVTLPANCNGKPYDIRDYAFYNCGVEEVTLSKCIKSIGKYAFYASDSLNKITFAKGTITVGAHAFAKCRRLHEVYMSDTIEQIEEYAFYDCPLVTVKFSSNLKRIEQYAFWGIECVINLHGNIEYIANRAFSSHVKNITIGDGTGKYRIENNCLIDADEKSLITGFYNCTIPDDGSVTSIERRAFSGNNMKSIHIPACITNINYGAFAGCTFLTTITIDEDNPNYKVVNNCLISIADKTLIAFTYESVIPDDGSVTRIAMEAVASWREPNIIRTAIIPKSVTQIDEFAFNSYIIYLKYDGTMKECAENTEYGKDVTKLQNVACIVCTDGKLYRRWVDDYMPN